MKERLGQEPSFPFSYHFIDNNGRDNVQVYKGMSKRFYAACAAMQGLIINHGIRISCNGAIEDDVYEIDKNLVEASYRIADELLKQEDL